MARAERLIRYAASRGAQIICLKELFKVPDFCKAQQSDSCSDLAEPIPCPTTEAMQEVARELQVVMADRSALPNGRPRASIATRRPSSTPTAACSASTGRCTSRTTRCSSKGHPSVPGEGPGFRVWKTRYATIGVLICCDQRYPEAARITSLLGAQVLFYPTAIGWHPDEQDEWGAAQVDAWRTAQRAHAIANGEFIGALNRIGHEEEPAPRESRSSAAPSSPIRSDGILPTPATEKRS